jgi:para-nitrobenzyl esterase
MKNAFTLLTVFLALHVNAQIVATQFGQVQGALNGGVYSFLGIPFAKPPVDTLRWKIPQNPDSWAGVLNTTAFAPACAQINFNQGDTAGTLKGDEDCLYLNVWTPQLSSANLPVLVFIHGGGNQQGSAGEVQGGAVLYDGQNMAARGNAVIVTIQYRLGPLGYLVHPGLEAESANGKAGNYAVLDQILALKWVRNNIAKFGGDTTKTMIFGESAGGVNVSNLLTSPLATGLFQRACIQSAGPVINAYADSKNKGVAFVDSFATTGTDAQKIAYMRSLPADSLLRYAKSPLQGGIVQMNWQPVVDGVVFPDFPFARIKAGNFNHVPVMVGSNSEEMGLSAPPVVTPGMVTALTNAYVPLAYRPQAQSLYPAGSNNTQARQSYIGMLTDAQFTTIARHTAQCVSDNQTEPVWRYFFTHKHTLAQLQQYGSYHGMELFYVFNNWENATLGTGPLFKPQDDSVQNVMLKYWVNFAGTGNPNNTGLVTWPTYKSITDCYLEIKATPDGSQCGLRTAQTDLWDDITGFVACTNPVIGVSEVSDANVGVYPNPAAESFTVNIPGESFRVHVTDISGKLVYAGTGTDLLQVDVSNWQSGVYLLQLTTGTTVYTRKLVMGK